MRYAVLFEQRAAGDLDGMRAFDATTVYQAIISKLTVQPGVKTRNRKPLPGYVPAFAHEQPVWELRVGPWRVIYSIEESGQVVHVWAIVKKDGKTTEELS